MPSLRIHFTMRDMGRTRLAGDGDPLWEVMHSGFRLNYHDEDPAFGQWKRSLLGNGTAEVRAGAALLAVLAPRGPYFPDFLTPPEASRGLEEGLEAMLSTPRGRLRAELSRLAENSPVPSRFQALAEGKPAVLRGVAAVLRAFHSAVISPHDGAVRSAVAADRARRSRVLAEQGVEGLLATLPSARWESPVLEIEYGVDRDLHLDGRGLLLVPSFFCKRLPLSLADPAMPPALIYPIDNALRWESLAANRPGGLEALMGPTRAAVLVAVGERAGATTTQLAKRLSASPASASRHTAVLRAAGLITTHRDGPAMLHTLTPLGIALLETPGPTK
ncbi:transcriptional regulator [Lentzea cavernae]|uniref:Transcriptional regulator n=2 Tax=Lentzea cavernae TaxID=2020703 RepID=A0ABQ3M2H3_9PSEU|nr:transcriptional regulator [Lentzea cavernae]